MKPLEKIILRGNDPTGHGYYGAKRSGGRRHKGVDLVCNLGDNVLAPISGKVTKVGYPYSFNLSFRYVEISNDTYRVRLMYVSPDVELGDHVAKYQVIGYAQDIAAYWNGRSIIPSVFKTKSLMTNHIHFEVYKNTLLTDPEPLLIVDDIMNY